MLEEPLSPIDTSRLVRQILENGTIIYSNHARDEMKNDGLVEADVERALLGGSEPAEWINGSWKYRFHSYQTWAVVTFRNEEIVVIITAWRTK